ncbi:MAG: flagellin biosynthesis protein FlgE, partial [Desulfobacterales bacterium]|nr:flagellin biosynthesis protein FlgE [Desulfobacterales bacterium]
MEEFTGRLGNFTANGVNSLDDIEYNIQDYESMPTDGYGFQFEYDGSSWDFVDTDGDNVITATDKPNGYGTATIIYSDATTIQLAFDGDTEVDLEIQLSQAAVATDSLGFDINAEQDLHIQGIEGLSYSGDTANDNTSLAINDPSVMTHDSTGLGIIWNPVTETWYWSNPEIANSAGTLVGNVTFDGTAQTAATVVSVDNAADFDMVASNITLMVDARSNEWDWNMPLKEDDFDNANQVFNFSPTNDPTLTIIDPGLQGAVASTSSAGTPTINTLYWDGTNWTASTGGGDTVVTIDAANSDNTQVQFTIWENDGLAVAGDAATVRYTFTTSLGTAGGDSLEFSIDPTPPEEYPNAVLTTSGATTSGIGIDWDQDSTIDMQLTPSANGATTLAAGLTAVFDINPNVAPDNYADATLTGDQTQAIIDLDNSGSGSDDDIVFTFEDDLRYGTSTDPYDDRSVINFDILGSTAWTTKSTSDLTTDGYFTFNTDFLGGTFGSTEMDVKLDFGTAYDGNNWINDSLSTTQYAKASSTTYQDSDGYAAGDLEGVNVSTDGTITGNYSNGQLIPLFRVGLARFYNNY